MYFTAASAAVAAALTLGTICFACFYNDICSHFVGVICLAVKRCSKPTKPTKSGRDCTSSM
jgi:hypothetical protein